MTGLGCEVAGRADIVMKPPRARAADFGVASSHSTAIDEKEIQRPCFPLTGGVRVTILTLADLKANCTRRDEFSPAVLLAATRSKLSGKK